ncbi:Uncharacterised protein [Mycobacteroides abscessus subsp. abscessus]|nr:Uncharacterised protein [Mycobacteroides abscessus subsp. abscessus]
MVVGVAHDVERLLEFTVGGQGAVGDTHQWRGNATHHLERARDRRASDRSHDPLDERVRGHCVVVERRTDSGEGTHRQVGVRCEHQERHGPAQAPGGGVELVGRVIGEHSVDRLRHDVVEVGLEADLTVRLPDVTEVDDVRDASRGEEMFDGRLSRPEVVAASGHREWRDQQDRRLSGRAGSRNLFGGAVATQRALRIVEERDVRCLGVWRYLMSAEDACQCLHSFPA